MMLGDGHKADGPLRLQWRPRVNAEILKGRWKEIKGDVKRRWGKLTDDDLMEVAGIEEMLLGMLEKEYGYARQDAEREYADFMKNYEDSGPDTENDKWKL